MQNRNGGKPRKLVVTLVVAAVFFWAPSIIPVRASPPIGTCGIIPVTWQTADTAYAFPLVVPCPPIHTPTPWPVIIGMLSAVSVIVNAAIISQTQCREAGSVVVDFPAVCRHVMGSAHQQVPPLN